MLNKGKPRKNKVKGLEPRSALAAVTRWAQGQTFKDIEATQYDSDVTGCQLQAFEPNCHRCRWPIGDTHGPDFKFCGEERVPGVSYCLEHTKRAFPKVAEAMNPTKEARDVELV